jgi:hypothetical protein
MLSVYRPFIVASDINKDSPNSHQCGTFDADNPVSGATCAGFKETNMKTPIIIAGALLALSSTVALSQEMSRDQLMQRQQQMQPGKNEPMPAPRTGDASQGGVQSGTSGSGTLMQQREQGMSPNQSQGSQSTGTIKQ